MNLFSNSNNFTNKIKFFYLIFLFLVVKPQVKSTISNEEVYTSEFDQYANDISGLGFLKSTELRKKSLFDSNDF